MQQDPTFCTRTTTVNTCIYRKIETSTKPEGMKLTLHVPTTASPRETHPSQYRGKKTGGYSKKHIPKWESAGQNVMRVWASVL